MSSSAELNKFLFAALERLDVENMTPEQIEAETPAEAAAEIARLRDALIEARHHVYQASIDRAQPTEASEALTLIDAALTASKEGKEWPRRS
jgi:hypothetical protein